LADLEEWLAEECVRVGPIGPQEMSDVLGDLERFWFGSPPRERHRPMLVSEFGETSYVARSDEGEVIAHLLGFVIPGKVGYIHLVAGRADRRGRGISRRFYDVFTAPALERGARRLKALASPFQPSVGFVPPSRRISRLGRG
jgi:Acetyltransferase (GNAT) family